MRQQTQEILEDKSLLLTQGYFKLQKLFEKKYGKDTVVLIEVGTFFETYEVNNEKENIGKAKEIAELLNIQLTRKNKSILENSQTNLLMAGVPAVSFEKHLSKIISCEKYTIVIIKQVGTPPNVKRVLEAIISPSTNFDFVQNSDENNTTSIIIDQIKGNYLCGYSAIDVTTGKCYFNEVYGTSEDPTFALDEVFNYMNMHKTNEIIITFANKDIEQNEILQYLELTQTTYHISTFRPKISYQNSLFKDVFNIQSLLTPIEHLDMERYALASESLAVLIDFIATHDSSICQKLSNPIKLDLSRYIYLGNNALEQLNILDTPHQNSIIKLINNTSTAMGKRLLKERLSHPIKDTKELKRRYELSNNLYDYHTPIEGELANIYDIERLTRRIKLNRLHPFELSYLYDSLLSIKSIIEFMENYKFFKSPYSSEELNLFITQITNTFNLDICSRYMLKDIELNMINSGVNATIDNLILENSTLANQKIIELNKQVFKEQIRFYEEKYANDLLNLSDFIAQIDLTVSNIKTAKKYNYTCPKIVESEVNNNFIELINLRHPIIENNQETGIYVPNDVILGDMNLVDKNYKDNVIVKNSKYDNITDNKIHGVLLYGINSSGKSSLMKSIGISVILAQAGLFVPASSMRFCLFDSLFTRISGADNISKGLSSFAVEMLELKNIFNRANSNSLILGDEISHSTETNSGVSIVASAILKLAKLQSIFVFATHLHQLPQLEELEKLKNIIYLHLSVMYEDAQDKLIFDRKLSFGSGSSIYGLEFAKSLHMDKEFLDIANKIRKKITDDMALLI